MVSQHRLAKPSRASEINVGSSTLLSSAPAASLRASVCDPKRASKSLRTVVLAYEASASVDQREQHIERPLAECNNLATHQQLTLGWSHLERCEAIGNGHGDGRTTDDVKITGT